MNTKIDEQKLSKIFVKRKKSLTSIIRSQVCCIVIEKTCLAKIFWNESSIQMETKEWY